MTTYIKTEKPQSPGIYLFHILWNKFEINNNKLKNNTLKRKKKKKTKKIKIKC